MKRMRLSLVQAVFIGTMLLAIPVAVFHYVSGRYAQAAIAAGGSVAGLLIARKWVREGDQRPTEVTEVEERPQTVFVPPPPGVVQVSPQAATAGTASTRLPREGWLRYGLLAGLAATTVMSLVLVAIYEAAAMLGRTASGEAARWLWALAHSSLVGSLAAMPLAAVALQLALGLVFATLYTGAIEPALSGPGWLRGVLFALPLWLLSVLLFLPLLRAGLLGLALGAGPVPALASLVAHLGYGATLGAVYALPDTTSLAAPAGEQAAKLRSEHGAAAGIVVGVAIGAGMGALFDQLGQFSVLLPEGALSLGGAVVGGAWGALLGALAGLGHATGVAHPPRGPRSRRHPAFSPPGEEHRPDD